MEVWKEYTIDDICKTIFAGGDAVKYNPTKNKTEENNIPIYANSVENEGLYGYCSKPLVTEPAVTVAARGAGTGFVCYRKYPYVPIVRLLTLIPNENVDAHFLYYRLKKNFIKGDGSAIPQLTVPMIKKERITLPSLPTQQKIANILSSLDDKIEVNRRINEQLEELAQALFKSWFVDFEPFKDGEFVESELGMIPEGCTTISLSKMANYLNGLAMQKFRPLEGEDGLPVLKIKELGQEACNETSELCSPSLIDEKYIVDDGDVIFSWSGTLLVKIWCGGTCGLNQHLFKVTSEIYPKWFVYLWTKFHLDRFIRIAKDKAVTMGHIKRGELDTSYAIVLNDDKMKELDAIMSPIIEQFINNNIEIRKLSNLRDTLLPKLMSGEIDVEQFNVIE